jgi:threonine dehydrogenase-like Zn-dependent dehydrogenase
MVQTAVDRAVVKGRVVIAGVCGKPDSIQPIAALMKEVNLRFVVFYTLQEFLLAARALAAGEIAADQLIAGEIGFDQFDETFSSLADGRLRGKYLVLPGTT